MGARGVTGRMKLRKPLPFNVSNMASYFRAKTGTHSLLMNIEQDGRECKCD